MYKPCVNFERNQTIRTKIIDDISHFRRPIFREWGTFSGWFSGVRGPNFTKRGEDTGKSWPSYEFVSELRYLAAFSKRRCLKVDRR